MIIIVGVDFVCFRMFVEKVWDDYFVVKGEDG